MDQIVYLKKRTAYSVLSVEGWINPLYEVPNFAGMTPLNIATRGWSINKGERGQFSIYVGLRFTFLVPSINPARIRFRIPRHAIKDHRAQQFQSPLIVFVLKGFASVLDELVS